MPNPNTPPDPKKMLDLTNPIGHTSGDAHAEIDLAVTSPSNLDDLKREYAERYEKMFGSDADAASRVKAVLNEGIVDVATRLSHIALHSPNERLAADAAKYLLDRVIFKAGIEDDELKSWMAQLAGKPISMPDKAPKPKHLKPPASPPASPPTNHTLADAVKNTFDDSYLPED